MTVAERDLWAALRKLDQGWRRQAPIGPYLADFVRHSARLIVEVDGYFHRDPERQARDAERTAFLNRAGYHVLRFDEREVRENLFAVVERLTEPFPLEGGRVGMGVCPLGHRADPGEAPTKAPERQTEACQPPAAFTRTVEGAPPSPALPPSRGKGE